MSSTFKNTVLAAALAMAAAGSANAAVYSGKFDPLYGAPFTGLYWEGVATFKVNDSCVVANGTASGGACNLSVLSATFSFYAGAGGALIDTFTFTNPVVPPLYSMTFDANKKLASVQTGFFIPAEPDAAATAAMSQLSGYAFHLKFFTDGAQLYHTKASEGFYAPDQCTTNGTFCGWSVDSTPGGRTPFTFETVTAPVPEPGTYALLLAGLAAVGAAARRKRA